MNHRGSNGTQDLLDWWSFFTWTELLLSCDTNNASIEPARNGAYYQSCSSCYGPGLASKGIGRCGLWKGVLWWFETLTGFRVITQFMPHQTVMAFSAAFMALLSHVFASLFYIKFNIHRISPPFTSVLVGAVWAITICCGICRLSGTLRQVPKWFWWCLPQECCKNQPSQEPCQVVQGQNMES